MAGLPAHLPHSGLPIIDSDHSELEFSIETHGCGTAVDLHNLPFSSSKRNVLKNHIRHLSKCECKDTAFFLYKQIKNAVFDYFF